MQASDAEVVILEDSLINLNCVDLAFVGGSCLIEFILRSARYAWSSWKSTTSISFLVLVDTR